MCATHDVTIHFVIRVKVKLSSRLLSSCFCCRFVLLYVHVYYTSFYVLEHLQEVEDSPDDGDGADVLSVVRRRFPFTFPYTVETKAG